LKAASYKACYGVGSNYLLQDVPSSRSIFLCVPPIEMTPACRCKKRGKSKVPKITQPSPVSLLCAPWNRNSLSLLSLSRTKSRVQLSQIRSTTPRIIALLRTSTRDVCVERGGEGASAPRFQPTKGKHTHRNQDINLIFFPMSSLP